MLHKRRIGLIGILGAWWIAAPVSAQEFSADVFTTKTNGATQIGKIFHSEKKDRVDGLMDRGGEKPVPTRMITDRESLVMYLIEPEEKLILVNATGQTVKPKPIEQSCVELTRILGPLFARQGAVSCKKGGEETVNGRKTVKWDVQLPVGKDKTIVNTMWVDPQLKWAIRYRYQNGESGELQEIKVGPQPASLFELPKDYKRQQLGQPTAAPAPGATHK